MPEAPKAPRGAGKKKAQAIAPSDARNSRTAFDTMPNSPQAFHALLDHIPAAMYTCDATGRIVNFNEAAVALWGLRPEVGQTRWCGSHKIYKPDGSALGIDECPMAIALKERRPIRDQELIIERPDGARRIVLVNPEPLFDAAGTLTGAINLVVDITARKESEADLAATKEALATQVTHLSHLHELALRLSHTPETEPALQAILETLVRVHSADFGLISLHNPATGGLYAGPQIGFDPSAIERLADIQPNVGNGVSGKAFASGRRVIVEDIETDSNVERYRDTARALGVRAAHSTPIMTRSGEMLGVISVQFRMVRVPTEHEMQFADVCARHAAEALEAGRARAALKASEHRFRQMADTAPAMLWMTDEWGTCTFLSRGWYEFTGKSELSDLVWTDAVHADDLETVHQAFRPCNKGAQPFSVDCRVRHADGGDRWVMMTGRPRFSETHEFLGYIGTFIDIDDRKRFQQELDWAHHQMRTVTDTMAASVARCSRDGKYVWVSRGCADWFGVEPEDLVGRYVADVLGPAAYDTIRPYFNRALAGEKIEFEALLDYQGLPGRRWVHVVYTPILSDDGEPDGLVAVVMDISRRKHLELAHRESEARFHHMADNAPVLIWVNGVEGCEFVNREYLRFTGRSLNELRGSGWQSILHPEDADAYNKAYHDAVMLLGPFKAQARLRGADGVYRWFRSTGVPRLNPDGTSLGYVGCSVDISEIKRSEEALREAKELAEAANEAKDRFLAVLSHELRTPLTPVLMAASALEKNADLPAWVREDAAMIRENIRLETRLIDDLLDLSRIASGKLQLVPEPCDLNDIVLHVCGMCRSNLEEKSLRLHCDLDENVGEIVADATRLQQVFWNILKNAAKFTPENGHIYVRTARVDEKTYRVEFRDTGVGIEPDALPRIFTAFEQGEQKLNRRYGGLGLGLAIARALVQLHGGAIRAFSEGVNKGTLFVVEIPVKFASVNMKRPLAKPPQPVSSSTETLRLLVVEDDIVTSKVLARLLQDKGYIVQTADSMARAMELVKTESFDLVVSDLSLPDASGYDLLSTLLMQRPMKAIAMSGFGAREDIERSLEVGFSAHLVKPVDTAELDQVIRQVCNQPE